MIKNTLTFLLCTILTLSLVACGENTAMPEVTTAGENTTIEEPTENEILSMTTAEKIKNFTLNGCALELPCSLGEFKKYFDVDEEHALHFGALDEENVFIANSALCDISVNENRIGRIYVNVPEDYDDDKLADDLMVYILDIDVDKLETANVDFDLFGIHMGSGCEDILRTLGGLELKSEDTDYYGVNIVDDGVDTTDYEEDDQISIRYNEKGMQSLSIFCKRDQFK